jgi:hypothetical protein
VDNRYRLWITAYGASGSTRIGVMTMTDTVGYRPNDWWTIDDLFELPDDGMRYELADGCLLMSPAPTPRHAEAQFHLRELLQRQAPPASPSAAMPEFVSAPTTPTSFRICTSSR